MAYRKSAVINAAATAGYWKAWSMASKRGGDYINKLSTVYCKARQAEINGVDVKDIPARVFNRKDTDLAGILGGSIRAGNDRIS